MLIPFPVGKIFILKSSRLNFDHCCRAKHAGARLCGHFLFCRVPFWSGSRRGFRPARLRDSVSGGGNIGARRGAQQRNGRKPHEQNKDKNLPSRFIEFLLCQKYRLLSR